MYTLQVNAIKIINYCIGGSSIQSYVINYYTIGILGIMLKY